MESGLLRKYRLVLVEAAVCAAGYPPFNSANRCAIVGKTRQCADGSICHCAREINLANAFRIKRVTCRNLLAFPSGSYVFPAWLTTNKKFRKV